jgi:putative flippase GtrA
MPSHKLLQRSIVKFAGVGVVSTTSDLTLLKILLLLHVNVYLATALGFLLGLSVGFLMNGKYVFGTERTPARYAKYGLISLGGLLLTEIIIHLLHVDFEVTTAFRAKLVAVGVVFFWNYTWSRFWAFK